MNYNKAMINDITEYNQNLPQDRRDICERLEKEIRTGLPDAESKVWHGAPVWFIEGNPVAGYFNRKNEVRLLFWSGRSFDEPTLIPEGTFKAAEARYSSIDQINSDDIQRWLQKSKTIQWDYKNIVKNKGVLNRKV